MPSAPYYLKTSWPRWRWTCTWWDGPRTTSQCIRLKDCTSATVVSGIGAPQGTVLSPVMLSLYTSDFQCDSELCHMQKYLYDTMIVVCVRDVQEPGRGLCAVQTICSWTPPRPKRWWWTSKGTSHIPSLFPSGVEVELVKTHGYLGLQLDDMLDCLSNMETICRKGQSHLYFLRRLGSFNICKKLLKIFYQSAMASGLFYPVVCWRKQ